MSNAALVVITAQDLVDRFGPIPLDRICFDPLPGTATEQDLIRLSNRGDKQFFELKDGILLVKPRSFPKGVMTAALGSYVLNWADTRNLGIVAGAGGTMRLAPGLIRYPDISFVKRSRFPNGKVQPIQVPDLVPDLAIEVLSPSNTRREMEGKRHDYFTHGTQLAWFVDPETRCVEVFTAPEVSIILTEHQTLDGGNVLPGFQLPIRKIFAHLSHD